MPNPKEPTRPLTLEEACALTAGASMWTTVAVPSADIPAFTMADGPMGIASGRVDERDISILTPCPTALGASWDTKLVERIGRLVGTEAAAHSVDALLAPNLNLARSPLAGRAFEYFSEDPLLIGVLGAAWISGLQSTGTGAIAKHVVCNDSETARDSVDVQIDEQALREVYLLPFELAAQAGCAGMLAAYNRVNGAWCSEQAHILKEIIRAEWGFAGVVMSDWFGTHSGARAINAGLDLEMPGPARFLGRKLLGEVAEAPIREAASRVASAAKRVSGEKTAPLLKQETDLLLNEAAAAGMVLLKNESSLLPLAPEGLKRLAVIGPNATAPCYQGGTFAKIAIAPDTPTPLKAIQTAYGAHCEVIYEPGVDPQPRLPTMPLKPAKDLGDGAVAGMTLEYFETSDCSGTPRFSETRDTNSLVWFAGVHKQSNFDSHGSIRASGRCVAQASGSHRFYLGSTGEARLLIGNTLLLEAGKMPEAKDVMGVLKRGDAKSVTVTLQEGQAVTITVEFRYAPARVQGLWYGLRTPDSPESMLARAVEAARTADVVTLCVGETSDSSVESKDRYNTKLPPEQLQLIRAICAVNSRTVIVVNVGHAFDAGFASEAAALLVTWYPGQSYARVLAAVLTGERSPGGRLPVTLAHRETDYSGLNVTPDSQGKLFYSEGVLIGYRALISNKAPALFPFGFGLSYTNFEIADAATEHGKAFVTVRNAGARPGTEVIQLYRDSPECALLGFAKVSLAPGEQKRISIAPNSLLMRKWQRGGWLQMHGPLPVRLARSAEDSGISLTIEL